MDRLLERLWSSEKRAREMESCVNRLNLQLTKKVLELNELQLQYSEQAKVTAFLFLSLDERAR